MIIKAENYYPSVNCYTSFDDKCINETKIWECARFNFRLYHFDSEDDFSDFARALNVDLVELSRPLPGDESPFNVVYAEFHPYQGDFYRRLIRGASIYVMNDAGKTIDVIRTDYRNYQGSKQDESRQVKYPGKKRKIVGVGAPTENKKPPKIQRRKVPVAGRQKAEQKEPYLVVHDDLGGRLPDDPRSILDRSYYTAVMVGLTQKDSHQEGPLCLNKSGLTDERVEIYPGQYLSILGGAPHHHVNWSQIRSWDNQNIVKTVKLASTSMIGFSEKSPQVEDWTLPRVIVHDRGDGILAEKADFVAKYDVVATNAPLFLNNGRDAVNDRIVVYPQQYIFVSKGELADHPELDRITRLVQDGTLMVIKDRDGATAS